MTFPHRPISRRAAIGASLAAAAWRPATGRQRPGHVVVVGAGAFGGWTALHLLRRGVRVTLLDAWGPGNSRASSGGETRVIRATYGPHRIYSEMVVRALEIWKASEVAWNRQLFVPTGALWMSDGQDDYVRQAAPILRDLGLGCEEMDGAGIARRFPQIHADDLAYGFFEEGAGYLLARRGCQATLRAFLAEGGQYLQAEAAPGPIRDGAMEEVRVTGGAAPLRAEQFVFAAGPWLSRMFPDFDPPLVSPTRQEVFYFGTPPGRNDLTEEGLPVWVENGAHLFYGVPGSERRGFKVADDTRGSPFDPTNGDRTPSAEGIRRARRYMEHRFPAMRGAPLLEARVCQYEQSQDGHLIVDTHPDADNVWILGGGSGHGYKMGPALGEMAARQILGEAPREPFFSLSRLKA